VQDVGCRNSGFRFSNYGLEFKIFSLGFRVQGSGFRVEVRLRVEGVGFRVSSLGLPERPAVTFASQDSGIKTAIETP
jgi:hypothetical protein